MRKGVLADDRAVRSEFFLIIIDEDRKQFTVEGPVTDELPWNRAIAAARAKGRNVRCCNIEEASRTATIATWQWHYGRVYRLVDPGIILLPWNASGRCEAGTSG
jgi:hypothetical protein